MSIIEKIAHWRYLAFQQNTTLDRVYLWPHEYRQMVMDLTGEIVGEVEPGLKGTIFDIPVYVRKPLNLTFLKDPGQMMRECA